MDPERTTTDVTGAMAQGVASETDPFGIRPSTDRPHSLNLSGPAPSAARNGVARGLDILLGVGIGAAAMYYLDPDRGAVRRSAMRDKLALLGGRRRDAVGALAG